MASWSIKWSASSLLVADLWEAILVARNRISRDALGRLWGIAEPSCECRGDMTVVARLACSAETRVATP